MDVARIAEGNLEPTTKARLIKIPHATMQNQQLATQRTTVNTTSSRMIKLMSKERANDC